MPPIDLGNIIPDFYDKPPRKPGLSSGIRPFWVSDESFSTPRPGGRLLLTHTMDPITNLNAVSAVFIPNGYSTLNALAQLHEIRAKKKGPER